VQGKDNIGMTYKLVDVETGKSFRELVPADRLKPHSADRTDLLARLPSNLYNEQHSMDMADTGQDKTRTIEDPVQPALSGCKKAIRIFKERVRNKKRNFLYCLLTVQRLGQIS